MRAAVLARNQETKLSYEDVRSSPFPPSLSSTLTLRVVQYKFIGLLICGVLGLVGLMAAIGAGTVWFLVLRDGAPYAVRSSALPQRTR